MREPGEASVPFEFDLHAMIYSDDAPKPELHKTFLWAQLNKAIRERNSAGVRLIRQEVEAVGIRCPRRRLRKRGSSARRWSVEKALALDNAK